MDDAQKTLHAMQNFLHYVEQRKNNCFELNKYDRIIIKHIYDEYDLECLFENFLKICDDIMTTLFYNA